jgi:hypothetical protein
MLEASRCRRGGSGASQSGDGGDITVNVGESLSLRDGATISVVSRGGGAAGNVEIRPVDGAAGRTTVTLLSGSSIEARSIGTADAGNITIDAGRQFVAAQSSVETNAQRGGGGRLSVRASEIVYASDAIFRTDVERGGALGDGGDVEIPPSVFPEPQLAVLNRSSVVARVMDGTAGNIRIEARDLLASQGIVADATSGPDGIPGTVEITGPDEQLAGQIAPLPTNFFDASELMTTPCAARTTRAGSLVVQTRKAIEPPPDAPLSLPGSADGDAADRHTGASTGDCPG